jgi:hypothetical protein
MGSAPASPQGPEHDDARVSGPGASSSALSDSPPLETPVARRLTPRGSDPRGVMESRGVRFEQARSKSKEANRRRSHDPSGGNLVSRDNARRRLGSPAGDALPPATACSGFDAPSGPAPWHCPHPDRSKRPSLHHMCQVTAPADGAECGCPSPAPLGRAALAAADARAPGSGDPGARIARCLGSPSIPFRVGGQWLREQGVSVCV